jgi:hypothetical protein
LAYNKTEWRNREVERPNTYTMKTNEDGTVTLTPAEGNIFSEGTPIVAENFIKIENQLALNDTHMNRLDNPHGVTASQVGAYTQTESNNLYAPISDFNELSKTVTNTKTLNKARFLRQVSSNQAVEAYSGRYLVRYYQIIESQGLDSKNYGATVLKDGLYYISASVGLANLDPTQTDPYIALTFSIVNKSDYRMNTIHFTQTGNLTIHGSGVFKLNAGDEIRTYVNGVEGYTVLGESDELRSFLMIQEL